MIFIQQQYTMIVQYKYSVTMILGIQRRGKGGQRYIEGQDAWWSYIKHINSSTLA